MAHRDTDTLKWDDSWFQGLSLSDKLLWLYICDKCDPAGVWKENRPLAEFQIGSRINWEESISAIGDRIIIYGDRWIIPAFIPFHYGTLFEGHKMYKKIVSCLEYHKMRYCIDTLSIVYLNDGNTLSQSVDSVKDKDKDKDKGKEEGVQGESPSFRECSDLLKSRILEHRQQKITEETLCAWDRDVRLMVERDSRTADDIKALINECHDMPPSPTGFTWRNNILSMGKLRERWNEGKIFIGMKTLNIPVPAWKQGVL